MSWPAVCVWLVAILGVFSDGPLLLYTLFVVLSFGTLQMVPTGIANGVNLVPATAVGLLMVMKIAIYNGNIYRMISSALTLKKLGWLAAFLVYSVSTAFVLPRIFAGRVEIFPISGSLTGTSLLHLTSGNITQSCYMILSVLVAVSISILGSRSEFRHCFMIAVMLNGIALITTGLIDITLYAAGLSALLDPFRNVTYALLTDVEQLGAKRIVGLMPEASSYGISCVSTLSMLVLLRPCLPPQHSRKTAPLVIAGLLIMSILSTASSAYLGLILFMVVFIFDILLRIAFSHGLARRVGQMEIIVLAVPIAIAIIAICTSAELRSYCVTMLDGILFEKTESASFLERSSWTSAGLHAFLETNGLGVGLGSVRVSNWFVSIIASTGVVGSILMCLAIASALIPSAVKLGSVEWMWQRALKLSLVPALGMGFVVGTTPDLGIGTSIVIGLIAACQS